ncbi:acetyl-coenzyme A synthetase, cytoplasmic-like [Sycon ciliatum]|uniref:acetyl-coenzyme A synthetase, cytoplasmic-like n=1 Tax=Sycon ciliatum TaxID=27933 RepID=UPI0031F6629F
MAAEAAFYPPNPAVTERAHVKSNEEYKEMYQRSIDDPDSFWSDIADGFYWKQRSTNKHSENLDVRNGRVEVEWMKGSSTNICYNVLDRHVKSGSGSKVAFFWEGNDPADSSKITYEELLKEVCKFSNVLKGKGVKRGDRVAIYLPMIVELVIAMLACARLGAVHSIVFSGFSSDSLAERILDSQAKILITSDGVYRGDKLIPLKDIADGAVEICQKANFELKHCVVVRHCIERMNKDRTNGVANGASSTDAIKWNQSLDLWWHDLMDGADEWCEPEWLDAEDPLFMLYTSGSTGRPKGVLHTCGGYMLWAATTFKYSFDYHEDDVYFCTADIGWITGHSYITYGPLANGATSVLFEGVPTFPDASRYWAIVDKYNVSKFYTAPTAVRALMTFGTEPVKKYKRTSLQVLGTVGEPINPEAWLFYYNVIGDGRCSIADTWWQTETGGHMITTLPGATPMKPGAAGLPFFGIKPVIVNDKNEELHGPCEGYLCIKQSWPGIMRTLFGNHERYEDVYFKPFPGYYYSGDGCRRDESGYYWLTGRSDDVLNVSGHRIGTAEIESALVEHDSVCEAAVVGMDHELKGQALFCFVTLAAGIDFTSELAGQLKQQVRRKVGPFASPDYIQEAPGLPKTRSGKIMRRILRKLAIGSDDHGDISTLADPAVVAQLSKGRSLAIRVAAS